MVSPIHDMGQYLTGCNHFLTLQPLNYHNSRYYLQYDPVAKKLTLVYEKSPDHPLLSFKLYRPDVNPFTDPDDLYVVKVYAHPCGFLRLSHVNTDLMVVTLPKDVDTKLMEEEPDRNVHNFRLIPIKNTGTVTEKDSTLYLINYMVTGEYLRYNEDKNMAELSTIPTNPERKSPLFTSTHKNYLWTFYL